MLKMRNSNSMIRGTSLAILALLAVVVLTTVIVSAAPRQQASTDATLSSLSLSGVDLGAAFNPAVTLYPLAAAPYAVSETTVTATPTDPNATVVIKHSFVEDADGIVPLSLGATFITVDVTAEDGVATKSYTIIVDRALAIATRLIVPATVAPGGTVEVFLYFGNYGGSGRITTSLPSGFTYVVPDTLPATIEASTNVNDPQILEITMLEKVSGFTYELAVAATATPGIYTLTGVLTDSDLVDHDILGESQITVAIFPGATVTPTDLTIAEGSSGTYTVALDTQPSGDVIVAIVDPTDNTDVTAEPAALTFTTSNWTSAQTVTVSAIQDADMDDDTATVTHTVSGYGTVVTAASVTVTVSEDPTAPYDTDGNGAIDQGEASVSLRDYLFDGTASQAVASEVLRRYLFAS